MRMRIATSVPGLGSLVCVLLALIAAFGGGCSSDEFGLAGTTFPSDVSQDSLQQLITVADVSGEETVVLALNGDGVSQTIGKREILYYGRLDTQGWEAVPLMQFDFSSLPDTLDFSPANLDVARLQLHMLKLDSKRGIRFDMAIYELIAPFDTSMVGQPVASLLGDELARTIDVLPGESIFFEILGPETPPGEIDAVKAKVSAWLTNGEHNGFALVDISGGDSTLVGLAAGDFSLSAHRALLAVDKVARSVKPSLTIELVEPSLETEDVLAPPLLGDITHIRRNLPTSALSLGSHYGRRLWVQFAIDDLPLAATINKAELVFHVDPNRVVATGSPADTTLAPTRLDLAGFEASLEVARTGDLGQADRIGGSQSTIDLNEVLIGTDEDSREFRLNITEYVQRIVNGVFESQGLEVPGILVALTGETLQLSSVELFDSSAADETLRPRIEIFFTPPADFGN